MSAGFYSDGKFGRIISTIRQRSLRVWIEIGDRGTVGFYRARQNALGLYANAQ